MSRSTVAVKLVALFALCCFAGPVAVAFDVPNPKPKKEKKKKDDTQDASGDSKPADSKPADNQPAQQKQPAPEADAPPPPAVPPSVFEMKLPKSMWDTGGIKDLKAGDWVEMESPMMGNSKTHQEVLEVGDHYTLVLNRTTMMGQTQEQKMKSIYSESDPEVKDAEKQRKELKIETKEFDDKVKVGDKEVSAKRYETYQDGKLVSKTWISKDVPLGGGVRVEGPDGKVMSQATGFGRGK